MKRLLPSAFLILAGLHAWAIQVYDLNIQHAACGTPSGAIDIYVSGGLAPYTFVWNNGATTEDISGLVPGLYEVTVTDANSDQVTGSWTIFDVALYSAFSAQDGHASCTGASGGQVQVIEWGINGTPPYSYVPAPDGYDPQGDPYFTFPFTPPGSMVNIDVTDANGCTGTLSEPIVAPQTIGGPNMQVGGIQGSCSTGSGGAVTITNVNDGSFFSYPDWSVRNTLDNEVVGGQSAGNVVPITGLPPGDYQFVREWDPQGMYMAWPCSQNPFDRIAFTIPDLGPDCGSVSGTVFIDNDQDCTQDAGEVGVPHTVLEVLPGPQYTITNSAGAYSIDLGNGSYSLAQNDPGLVQLCPVAVPAPFTINFNPVTLHLADSSTVALDLGTQLESTAMRPGFAGTYWGRVRNLSPQVSGAVTIALSIDAALSYTGATPVPTNVTGNTLTWQLANFTALQSMDLQVQVNVPVGMPLGTPLSTTLSVVNTLSDADPSNDSTTREQTVTGSYDPNDKTARTSTGTSDALYLIDQDEWIDYTIRFQNTGTDTAFTVVVTDTLPPTLDMASFEQGAASHAFDVAFKLGRVVEWRFEDILLPDSNVNEPASHGLVSFRIKPHEPLLAGTTIANTANIFFDFNPPVITEPSFLVAEFSTGVQEQAHVTPSGAEGMRLQPNPAHDVLQVILPEGAELGFTLLTADGRVLHPTSTQRSMGIDVDVRGLAPGIYMVRTKPGTARFVKQ